MSDSLRFLEPSPSAAATVSQNWKTILAKENLNPDDQDAANLQKTSDEGSDANVLIDSTKFWSGITDDTQRGQYWAHKFSSERNSAYFGGIPDNDSSLQSTAWVGDSNNCLLPIVIFGKSY